MIATKAYGFTPEMIDWSSPSDMRPYLKEHKEELKEQDYMAWLSNQYTLSAVSVALEHCFAGKKAKSKYIEKPIMQEIEQKQTENINQSLTEEEKKKQTEKLFMQLRIMGANFNLNHDK